MITSDILGQRARLTPDKTALVTVASGERLTYRELDTRAERWARVMLGPLGLRPGDRVALLANNRPAFVVAFFGAAKAGLTLVPLGARLCQEELGPILADSGARAALYAGRYAETICALQDRPELTLDHWVALDAPARSADLQLGELLDQTYEHEQPQLPQPHPEMIHCLLYTSGTTGRPKGVRIPQRMVAFNGLNTVACWQLREDEVSPIFTPLYHAGGLGAFLVPIFTVGGTVVLHDGFDAGEVLTTIAQERCTVLLGVPTIFSLLLESPSLPAADLSSLRWLISGGALLPPSLIDAYRGLGLVLRQGYGLSEVGVNCFAMTDEDAWRKPGSIGKPVMFSQVRLLDDSGCEVADGEVGELCFFGPHVSAGYHDDPVATAAAYTDDGWFRSGDLARRDDEGYFYIAGRRKEMFISGGVNIYPAEIEGALRRHPQVSDASVIGVDNATWGEVGVGFVVPRAGTAPSADELAAWLEQRLARFKVPRRFVLVSDLPRTAYGKVRKGELREAYLATR